VHRVIYWPVYLLVIEPSSLIDSEYAKAGILDPKIIITTSRDPSSRLLQFAKVRRYYHRSGESGPLMRDNCQEMRLVFPNAHRINRGGYVVKELAEACRANDITDLVILHEHRGVPGLSNAFCFDRTHLSGLGFVFVRRNDRIALSTRTHGLLHSPLRQPPP
jgi:hypothetical protein